MKITGSVEAVPAEYEADVPAEYFPVMKITGSVEASACAASIAAFASAFR